MISRFKNQLGVIESEIVRLLFFGSLVMGILFGWQIFISPLFEEAIPQYTRDGKEIPDEVRVKLMELYGKHKAQAEGSREAEGSTREQKEKSEKSFQQAISDIAWGRHRKGAAKPSGQVVEPVPQPQSADEMRIHQDTMRARAEYCSKNMGKDPTCR